MSEDAATPTRSPGAAGGARRVRAQPESIPPSHAPVRARTEGDELSGRHGFPENAGFGEVAERLNAPVLKTGRGASLSRV